VGRREWRNAEADGDIEFLASAAERTTTRPRSTTDFTARSSRTTRQFSLPSRFPSRSFSATLAFDDSVENGSVALVVTSPPYFAGKQYEEDWSASVPASYLE